MRNLISLVIVLAALAGCSKRSEKFCAMNPLDERCDPSDSTGVPCDDQNPCTTGVCENNVCVECNAADASACMDATPVCNTETNQCVACALHSECDSLACLPTGECGTEANVAYVAPTGGPGMCTRDLPCKTVSDALDRERDYVKMIGTTTETVTVTDRTVTFLAEPGAKLQPDTPGDDALTVAGMSDVTVYDLTITNGSSNGRGVLGSSNMATTRLHRVTVDSNSGAGIFMTGGTLVVSSSTISQNLGGGIETANNVKFDITNTFIFKNGNTSSTDFGGVKFGIPGAMPRFEFNTVASNVAVSGNPAGVRCSGQMLDAANNIIAGNLANTTPNQHTIGQCGILTSKVQDDITDLNFASPEVAPLSFRLTAGSSAIDQPTTASDIGVDFEGDPRPAGATDVGADELTP
jgi:hypothetical protein